MLVIFSVVSICSVNRGWADLIVNLQGQEGSSEFVLDASGSVEVLQNRNFSVFTVSTPASTNPIYNGVSTGSYEYTLPEESTLALRGQGFFSEFHSLEITVNNGHTFTLRANGIGPFPVGSTLSIEGSAAIDLASIGFLFDNFNVGSYSLAQPSSTTGERQLNVIAAVPEPSSSLLCLVGFLSAVCFQRRDRSRKSY